MYPELAGRILIADDEELFLESTGDLLRREGFECECVPDAHAALERLKVDSFDLLIADIKMPGNPDMELVQTLQEVTPGLPVVIVTGYPSLRSAIQSVQLPVVGYLIKPIALDQLLDLVQVHTERFRAYRAVQGAQARLHEWHEELTRLEQLLRLPPVGNEGTLPAEAFLALTLRNIAGSLHDVQRLVEAVMRRKGDGGAEWVSSLAQPNRLLVAIQETIEVLEKTKSAFKSKDLGELRKKLESLVKEARS